MGSQVLMYENVESRTETADCTMYGLYVETTTASGHSTFRIILTNWKVPGVPILVDEGPRCHREVEETRNILPGKKILRLIQHGFKCLSCHLEAEEADLFWVDPRGWNYD